MLTIFQSTPAAAARPDRPGAVQLAIARALLQVDGNLRGALKTEGLLRRDPRMKERKKSGQPGRPQTFPVLETIIGLMPCMRPEHESIYLGFF